MYRNAIVGAATMKQTTQYGQVDHYAVAVRLRHGDVARFGTAYLVRRASQLGRRDF